MSDTVCQLELGAVNPVEKSQDHGVRAPASPALARLIDEVRIEKADGPHAYNRMHNRHNRSR